MPAALILCALIIIALAFCIVSTIYYFKGKGKKIKITVVKKRKTFYSTLNQITYSTAITTHYTIDCTYENSAKIHTLGCEWGTYERLRKNRSYIVTVKMGEIIKVHKK